MPAIPKDFSYIPDPDSPPFILSEDYKQLFYNAEDRYKYEWDNGKNERTAKTHNEQATLQEAILDLFYKTPLFQAGGILVAETAIKRNENQNRQPDLCIYTVEQKRQIENGNKNQVPSWVGVIISESDKAHEITTSLDVYFAAGVQVVWFIYPFSKQVYVYTSPEEVTICRGKTICNAEPIIQGFKINAKNLFNGTKIDK